MLEIYGIRAKVLSACVRIGESVSRCFRVKNGLRQRCGTSIFLFKGYVNDVVRALHNLTQEKEVNMADWIGTERVFSASATVCGQFGTGAESAEHL